MSIEITTATAASDAELVAGTTFLWGQAGAGPVGERRVPITRVVTRDSTGTVPGVSKHARVLVNSANPVWDGEALSALAIGSGIAAAFANSSAASPTLALWNTAAAGNNQLALFATDANGATRGSISFNRAGGAVAYNTASDYRSKDVLGPVKNPGAVIDALRPIIGQMKGATEPRPMFVAHEVVDAGAPYAVTGEKDAVDDAGAPVFQQLDVSLLIPLMVAELQALRARVAALEATSQLFHGR